MGRTTQLGALYLHVQRMRAGLIDEPRGWCGRGMLTHRAAALFTGLSRRRCRGYLEGYLRELEQSWGQPATALEHPALGDPLLFAVEKATALQRFERRPDEVTEGFIAVGESAVGTQPVAPRRLYYQRWRPVDAPSGVVVLISPGYQETGRNFLEQTALLTSDGHEVLLLDHQWAGHTHPPGQGPTPGLVDRGFGAARDVAAAGALAAALAQTLHGDSGRVVLAGTSMGGGPGVLGALALLGAGQLELTLSGAAEGISLEGAQLPLERLGAVLQSPYLAVTPGLANRLLALLGRVPGLRRWAAPVTDLPLVTRHPLARTKFASHAARGDVRTRPDAMYRAADDLTRILELAHAGHVRQPLYVIHGSRDTMTDPRASRELVQAVVSRGGQAVLELVDSPDHIFEEDPRHQRRVLEGVRWVEQALAGEVLGGVQGRST